MARPARGAIVRQRTASLYEKASERAAQIAQEICDEIRRNPDTPFDPAPDGIHLRDAYHVVRDHNGDALIKSRVRYWKFVEFGTRRHGDAQRHLRPAIEVVRARHT